MIESDFSDYMHQKQFLILNEINTTNDSKGRKHFKNKLKSLITDPTVMINPKGLPSFSVKNVFNILMTTNESHPLDVEADDRRFSIFRSKGLMLDEIMGCEYSEYMPLIKKEIHSFYQYLMGYRCDFNLYNKALETTYKAKLKGMSQTFDDRFALAIATNNISYFEENITESTTSDNGIYPKEATMNEYKECVANEFISNEFMCSIYRTIKGVDSKNQFIKGRLASTGTFEKYYIEDIQVNRNGKTLRGVKLRKEING